MVTDMVLLGIEQSDVTVINIWVYLGITFAERVTESVLYWLYFFFMQQYVGELVCSTKNPEETSYRIESV